VVVVVVVVEMEEDGGARANSCNDSHRRAGATILATWRSTAAAPIRRSGKRWSNQRRYRNDYKAVVRQARDN